MSRYKKLQIVILSIILANKRMELVDKIENMAMDQLKSLSKEIKILWKVI